MAIAVAGRTESGDNFLFIDEEDVLNEEMIMSILQDELFEEVAYISELSIVSTVEFNQDKLRSIASNVVARCEELQG